VARLALARRLSMETAAERLTRQSGTNFYYAFRILPEEKRQAIYALYSFCRVVDDCVDEEGGEGEAGLRRWTDEVERCYLGCPATELGRELGAAIERFKIPRSCLLDIVEGCRMDLTPRRYASFADLRVYCERVASAVGLASIEIFGYTQPATRQYAVDLGLALQLTNILRDVAQDAARGRLYLPLDELARFGVAEDEVMAVAAGSRAPSPALQELMAFQGERARGHYERARAALPAADRRSMLSAEIMGAVYREILHELARRRYPVGGPRVTLSTPRKLWAALRAVGRTLFA
jgi:15-cis-phytoene synthase